MSKCVECFARLASFKPSALVCLATGNPKSGDVLMTKNFRTALMVCLVTSAAAGMSRAAAPWNSLGGTVNQGFALAATDTPSSGTDNLTVYSIWSNNSVRVNSLLYFCRTGPDGISLGRFSYWGGSVNLGGQAQTAAAWLPWAFRPDCWLKAITSSCFMAQTSVTKTGYWTPPACSSCAERIPQRSRVSFGRAGQYSKKS